MGIYIVTLVAFFSFLFSFFMMMFVKQKPPKNWGEWPYSKNRIALWLNQTSLKNKYVSPLRIDRFHFIGLLVSSTIFIFSFCIMILDLSLEQIIYKNFGPTKLIILCIFILLNPILYEVFLNIWWSFRDKKFQKYADTKTLQKISKHKSKDQS